MGGTGDDTKSPTSSGASELLPRFREDARSDDDFAAVRDVPAARGGSSLSAQVSTRVGDPAQSGDMPHAAHVQDANPPSSVDQMGHNTLGWAIVRECPLKK